ncbi:MAG: DUF6350 family protein [Actinomycetota bacterium]|nr:DUF6350 family protein [Actinomycetota bacterium]MDQ2955775.1 DUF6350 family protein [Actinomycetota bacterium]
MNGDDELPAGWLTLFRRGVLSGAGLLLLAIGLCAIPAFAVWLVPGADTTPASSAVKAGALLALSASHGGIELNGTVVTLTPLLVTLALAWLTAGQARRAESWSGVVGLAVGYGAAAAAVAGWARLGSTEAPVTRTALAAMLFIALVGGTARTVEIGWSRLSDRWQRVCQAALAASCCYLLAGSLLAAAMLAGHFHEAAAMQRQLAPGAAGLPVALLGVAAVPNAVLAAVGYLTGPGFELGTHSSVSVLSVSHGQLPIFPLLAGVPHGRPATVFGLLAILVLAAAAGWLVLRMVAESESWTQRLFDVALAAVLTGGLLATLSALAAGRIGSGALRGIGPTWWAVGACTVLVLLAGSAAWLAVEVLRGKPVELPVSLVYQLRPVDSSQRAVDSQQRADAETAVPAKAVPDEPADRSRHVS